MERISEKPRNPFDIPEEIPQKIWPEFYARAFFLPRPLSFLDFFFLPSGVLPLGTDLEALGGLVGASEASLGQRWKQVRHFHIFCPATVERITSLDPHSSCGQLGLAPSTVVSVNADFDLFLAASLARIF